MSNRKKPSKDTLFIPKLNASDWWTTHHIVIICDAQTTQSHSAEVSEFQEYSVALELARIIEAFGGKSPKIETSQWLVEQIAKRRPLEALIVNIGAGLSKFYRFAQSPMLLEIASTDYSGPTPFSMILARDKYRSNLLLKSENAVNAPPACLIDEDIVSNIDGLQQEIFPVIVKPNDSGNSRGIDGRTAANATEAKKIALKLINEGLGPVIVEKFIPGLEATALVYGNGTDREVIPIGLVRLDGKNLPENYIRSHADKISPPTNMQWRLLNTILPDTVRNSVIQQSLIAYDLLGCRDCARFDFRVDQFDKAWFIEANAQPDLASWSSYTLFLNEYIFGKPTGLLEVYLASFFDRIKPFNNS